MHVCKTEDALQVYIHEAPSSGDASLGLTLTLDRSVQCVSGCNEVIEALPSVADIST